MKSSRAIIADVPDFWMDDKGDDGSGMELGEHNADRIIDALSAAGFIIVHHSQVKTEAAPRPTPAAEGG